MIYTPITYWRYLDPAPLIKYEVEKGLAVLGLRRGEKFDIKNTTKFSLYANLIKTKVCPLIWGGDKPPFAFKIDLYGQYRNSHFLKEINTFKPG